MTTHDADSEREMSLARRHTVNRSGTTHTFHFHRGRNRILGIICLAFAVLSLVFLWAALKTGHLTAWSVILGAGVALFMLSAGIEVFRMGVQVSGRKLTIHNALHPRKVVDASDIRAITLRPVKAFDERWVAFVELTGGRSIQIQSFDCGPTNRPPKPELAATVDEVRALLGVTADDISHT